MQHVCIASSLRLELFMLSEIGDIKHIMFGTQESKNPGIQESMNPNPGIQVITQEPQNPGINNSRNPGVRESIKPGIQESGK